MRKVRFTEEQITYALRQAESGKPVAGVCRQLGVSEQSFYRRKRKYEGIGIAELKRLRRLALYIKTACKTSMRRAFDLVQENRSMVYYRSCKRDPAALRIRLEDLAAVRVRSVYRLYREEGLEVRTKKRRKRISALRVVLPAATAPNERWSTDFVADPLYDGPRFRALTLVDHFTRESPAIEVGSSIAGNPVENAYIESFNGRLDRNAWTKTGFHRERMPRSRSRRGEGITTSSGLTAARRTIRPVDS